jgi:hypothetical protein
MSLKSEATCRGVKSNQRSGEQEILVGQVGRYQPANPIPFNVLVVGRIQV